MWRAESRPRKPEASSLDTEHLLFSLLTLLIWSHLFPFLQWPLITDDSQIKIPSAALSELQTHRYKSPWHDQMEISQKTSASWPIFLHPGLLLFLHFLQHEWHHYPPSYSSQTGRRHPGHIISSSPHHCSSTFCPNYISNTSTLSFTEANCLVLLPSRVLDLLLLPRQQQSPLTGSSVSTLPSLSTSSHPTAQVTLKCKYVPVYTHTHTHALLH